jgi:uncharacterized protein (DUF4213/DUF364 family)
MILNETLQEIQTLYGGKLDGIRIDKIIIGLFFTGVELSNGFGGVGYTPTADLHGVACCSSMAVESPTPVRLKGLSVTELLNWKGNSPLTNVVKLVVMNALSAPFLNEENYRIVYDADALDLIDLCSAGKIGMVGAFVPFLKRFKVMEGIDLSVVEQKKDSLRADEMQFYVPAEQASVVLPACDTVIITGASIANGTIDDLLSFTRPGATVIVTGPTASMLPDALFQKNASIVSGVEVTDTDKALDLLAEGAGAYRLFTDACVRKINILKG